MLNFRYGFFSSIMSFRCNENVMVTAVDVVTVYDITIGDWLELIIQQ